MKGKKIIIIKLFVVVVVAHTVDHPLTSLKLELLLISLGVRDVIFYVYTSPNHVNQVLQYSPVLKCFFFSGNVTREEAEAHPVLV